MLKGAKLLGKTVWQFIKELNIKLSNDLAIPVLVIHSRELKTHVYTKTCSTQMFIAVLFILVKKWKQPSCPSADEWINKKW